MKSTKEKKGRGTPREREGVVQYGIYIMGVAQEANVIVAEAANAADERRTTNIEEGRAGSGQGKHRGIDSIEGRSKTTQYGR